jgi:hypothetical protein
MLSRLHDAITNTGPSIKPREVKSNQPKELEFSSVGKWFGVGQSVRSAVNEEAFPARDEFLS